MRSGPGQRRLGPERGWAVRSFSWRFLETFFTMLTARLQAERNGGNEQDTLALPPLPLLLLLLLLL